MKKRDDLPFLPLIIMIWCNDYLLQYLRMAFARLPLVGQYSHYLIPMLYAIAIFVAVIYMRVLQADDVLPLIGILITYLISPVIHPETIEIWNKECVNFFVSVFPFYLVGCIIVRKLDISRLLKILYPLSAATILLKILYSILGRGDSSSWLVGGDMDTAYKLLPHICMLFYMWVKKPSIIKLALVGISTVYLTLLGNRGSLLIMIVSCLLLFFMVNRANKRTWLVLVVGALLVVLVMSPLFDLMMQNLEGLASRWGMSTRIFDKIASGSLGDLNNRDIHAQRVYSALAKSPVIGLGLYGDRALLGTYPHSIIAEVCGGFGYVFGIPLLVAMAIAILYVFFRVPSLDYRAFLLIIMGNGCLKLFLSGSYLTENTFFMMIGMCISLLSVNRVRRYTRVSESRISERREWFQ